MKSIYEQIDDCVRLNGCLPSDFALRDAAKTSDPIQSHLGELEGLVGSRIAASVDEKALETCISIIKENLEIAPKLAVHNFDDYDFGFPVASIRGHLLKKIIDNMYDFDPHKLSTLAYSLVMFGEKTETVKLGLLLLVLFDFANDEVAKKHIVTMGMYEDFTSYVISNTKSFADEYRNHIYYVYGRKLSGWGKINAVAVLEPINDEVREWLLCEGCRNDVSYALTAKLVADKVNLIEVLKKGMLTDAQMNGVRDIVYGLLEGENGGRISEYSNPAQFIALYLGELVKHEIKLEDIANLYRMESYLEKYDKKSEKSLADRVIVQIERILAGFSVEDKISRSLMTNPEVAIRAAKEGRIDISDELLTLLQKDYENYCQYGDFFLANDINVKDFLEVSSEHIIKGASPDLVLNYIDRYPGEGVEILRFCLETESAFYRSSVADVVLTWEKNSNANVKKISSDLFKDIKKLKKKETDDNLKLKWDEIIAYK